MTTPETPVSESFASWLKAMSQALGYSREADLARALDLPQSTVLRWRRGSRPSVEHLAALSRVLKTDLVALLALTGHISAGAATARLPEPPSPRTETERRIDEASLPDEMKATLHVYLAGRTAEEDARVRALIEWFTGTDASDLKAFVEIVHATTLHSDVTAAYLDLAAYDGPGRGEHNSPLPLPLNGSHHTDPLTHQTTKG